jgi:hypothetical protein
VRSVALVALVATLGCHSTGLPPDGFGVNVTIHLAPGVKSQIANVTLAVSGDESYETTLALKAFSGDDLRVQYQPGISSGTITFGAFGNNAGLEVVAGGTSGAITLTPGHATTANITVASDTIPDLGTIDTDLGTDLGPNDLGAPIDMSPPPDLSLPPDMTVVAPKRVFVTSTLYNANLGGVAGADSKCQARAAAAGLTGTYKAWLADSLGHSPSTRMSRSTGEYVLVNGSVVGLSYTDLTSGTIHHAINLTESGGAPPTSTGASPDLVWTDSSEDGTLFDAGLTCGDWTDATPVMSCWGKSSVQANWSLNTHGGNSTAIGCGSMNPLYCFEQ